MLENDIITKTKSISKEQRQKIKVRTFKFLEIWRFNKWSTYKTNNQSTIHIKKNIKEKLSSENSN